MVSVLNANMYIQLNVATLIKPWGPLLNENYT